MAIRDPHAVLGVSPGASQAAIKAAWRRLAREHHPDLAGNSAERRAATRRMAAINAAYAELRPPPPAAARRGAAGAQRPTGGAGGAAEPRTRPQPRRPAGPPPPPPTRPVTARFDTSDLLRPRNATTTPRGDGYRHHPRGMNPPRPRPEGPEPDEAPEPPRASEPTGPSERLRARRARRRTLPTLAKARATTVNFGKYHGCTLEEIAAREPSYVSWLARFVTRDPDLLDAARVVASGLGRHASV